MLGGEERSLLLGSDKLTLKGMEAVGGERKESVRKENDEKEQAKTTVTDLILLKRKDAIEGSNAEIGD